MSPRDAAETKSKLLTAARDMIRAKGYSATTVDDICAAAGVTKGGFFHHFAGKEQLGIAAAERFDEMAAATFAAAPYRAFPDPRDRVLGYVDFRAAMLAGDIPQYTCLLGTMVQEVYDTHPEIAAACDRGMSNHVRELARDIASAKEKYAPGAAWTPESLGYHMQSVLQGAFIFTKAKHNPAVARESLAHLRRYIESLFPVSSTNG